MVIAHITSSRTEKSGFTGSLPNSLKLARSKISPSRSLANFVGGPKRMKRLPAWQCKKTFRFSAKPRRNRRDFLLFQALGGYMVMLS